MYVCTSLPADVVITGGVVITVGVVMTVGVAITSGVVITAAALEYDDATCVMKHTLT